MTIGNNGQERFLNQYLRLTLLGEGGMGEVWAALDTSALGVRIVALKTTKQQGTEAAKVLFDEARIASQIDHPNVCRVHEFGRVGDTQYLVLDWCDGASLHELLQSMTEQVIPLELSAWLGIQVAAGLHAAHEVRDEQGEPLGVVHRDVSPQNVLLSRGGGVAVTDFGVAKAAGQAHRATETGEVKGKLSYMAPEQVRSKNVDRRADVFALGCVLYQITLGRRAFAGTDALSTMYQIVEGRIALPHTLQPDYPLGLESVVMRALARDPAERFQTAGELGAALQDWLFETNQRVTEKHLARLLEQHLGEKIAARNRVIFEQARLSTQLEASQPETAAAAAVASGTSDDQTQTTLVEGTARPSSRGLRLTLLGAVPALLMLIGLWIWLQPGASRPVGSGDAPAPTSDQAAPRQSDDGAVMPLKLPAPAAVVIEVSVKPSDAEIYTDGKLLGVGQAELSRPSGSGSVELSFRRDGFVPSTRSVLLDRSRQLEIQLVGIKPSSAAPRPTLKIDQAGTGGRPATLTKKPPRRLDVDNPFGPSGSP